ncbi:hypothetical protein [Streptomyces sp. NPDC094032]|uniref:hypothetical protein n=1 Tax=Streptomyces sp. NPDC094032 TaxID=3155308 RepID=UPI003332DA6D
MLALAACGAARPAGSGTASGTPRATPPAPDAETAFARMLATVEAPCAPGDPAGSSEPGEGEAPRTRPTGPLPVEPTPPPVDGGAPGASKAELDEAEKCGARLHAARVGKELDALADPTPAQVRAVLNRLGYPEGRIHRLAREGGSTRFLLDLRFMGGRLVLKGSATAGKSAIEPFALSPEEPVTNVKS